MMGSDNGRYSHHPGALGQILAEENLDGETVAGRQSDIRLT